MRRASLFFITLLAPFIFSSTLVAAYDPTSTICQSSSTAKNSSLCQCSSSGLGSSQCNDPSQNPLSGKNGLLHTVTIVIASLAGVAAVAIIIAAGLRYITSGGDPTAIKAAKDMLVAAVVGIIIVALAEGLINFVISRV